MSVLVQILREREGWANRNRGVAVRVSAIRAVAENALLIGLGILFFNHHEVILTFIKSLLSP